MGIRFVVVILAATLISLEASAGSCPAIRRVDSRGFAAAEVGGRFSSVPPGAKRLPNCLVDSKRKSADCEFVDSRGAAYLVFGGEITRIEYRDDTRPSFPLPFGLAIGMPISATVKAVEARVKRVDLGISDTDGTLSIGTGLCLRNRSGDPFALYFIFDGNDKLKVVGESVESEGD